MRRSGVHITYRALRERDGRARIVWTYHCCKECDWYMTEGGWSQCDWRDDRNDAAHCVCLPARIEGMRRMIALAKDELRQMEADL